MKLKAHAKLNLSLAVGRRRDDGFHNVDTIVQTIELADLLTIRRRRRGVRVSNDAAIPPGEDLCFRAATVVLGAKGVHSGVSIEVRKRVPLGAGLGGGSSDAAATARAVDLLYPPRLPPEHLAALCARLGSDVPLFLTGGRVRATGRGEQVAETRPTPGEWYVVLIPPFSCSTREVYAAHRSHRQEPGDKQSALAFGRNDLLLAATECFPALTEYVDAVRSPDALYSGLTGSGSACYAAFSGEEAARRWAEQIRRQRPEAAVLVASAVPYGIQRLTRRRACRSP
jgi:4-diphosphocytidyl-2-C-methyl-D-erythritol kinase